MRPQRVGDEAGGARHRERRLPGEGSAYGSASVARTYFGLTDLHPALLRDEHLALHQQFGRELDDLGGAAALALAQAARLRAHATKCERVSKLLLGK